MSSFLTTNNPEHLVHIYSPILYFTRGESCYPITIQKYLSKCVLITDKNPTVPVEYDNFENFCTDIYNRYQNSENCFLEFKDKDCLPSLESEPQDSFGYVRIIPQAPNKYLFVYFYLFSHTSPYDCCNCLCPLTSYAHRADLKFVTIEVIDSEINRIYYGAHSSLAGEWVDVSQVSFIGTHPKIYSCHGDHSFYPTPNCFPRICGIVTDVTEEYDFSSPNLTIVYGNTESRFKPSEMGWLYLPGTMNQDGVDSPSRQWWFSGDLPSVSNNWFKRLFCPCYW